MKRIRRDRTAAQRTDNSRRRHPTFLVLILCLVLTAATAISTVVLGGSLSRFSREESHVIPLVAQTEPPGAVEEKRASDAATLVGAQRSESPGMPSATTVPQSATARRNTEAENNRAAARPVEYSGELGIQDAVLSWSTQTQVDLFKESYSETVKAGDGSKIIAPGTSNFYAFTLENNGNLPLDYTISLDVESYGAGTEGAAEIPLEWRLLAGDGAAVSDWRGYGATAEVLKQARLDARQQDNYTIEWRWAFEQGADTDGTDTKMGDLAAAGPLGAKATITVYAEGNTELIPSQIPGQIPDVTPAPGGGGQSGQTVISLWPKTGDTSRLGLYIVLMTISGGGLLTLLLQKERQRKKGRTQCGRSFAD